jgi:hypothetical protein
MIMSILLVSIAFIPVIMMNEGSNAYSNQYLFDEATDILFDTNPRYGSLDPVNTRDIYRIKDLVGDENNYGANAHRITISLIKEDGANVEGRIYEPNGRPLAYLFSSGARSEVEFYIPYNGDYFLEIMTNPAGSSSDYRYEMGGVQNSNNNLFDGNNKPGSGGFSGSKIVGGNMHPTHDIVDYHQYRIPPFRAIKVLMWTESDFLFDILDENEDLVDELEIGEEFEYRNDGGDEVEFLFRVYYPLDGNTQYFPSQPSYSLNLTLWSHTTIPVVNPSNTWPNTFMVNEDTPLYPYLNLSTHFIEENGDDIQFEITSTNENIEVSIEEVPVDTSGQDAWSYYLLNATPRKNWAGSEIISLKASDLDGSVSDSFTMEVREVNDLPVITKIGGAEYTGGVFNAYGLEDELLVYKMNYSDADDPKENLFFTTNASSSLMPFLTLYPNGTMVLSPDQDDVGNYYYNVTLEDGRGGSHIVDVALAIEPVNDQPHVPEIEIVKGNLTLLPEELITLKALNINDPDGDTLTITWDWGDGRTSEGLEVSHIYSTTYSGNTTITVTVSDGYLSASNEIKIYVEAPEDVAKGDLTREVIDPSDDAVKAQEEWRITNDGERVFRVSTKTEIGLDILSIRSQRRGSSMRVFLDVKDTIQIDGTFSYHLFIMKSGYQENDFDFRNLSDWASIPLRYPDSEDVIASRSYIGDPSIYENSTGTIFNRASLVWTFTFNELVENGLTLPIDPADFDFYAVVVHTVDLRETGNLAERYIVTDTAGEGALVILPISPSDNSSGSSSSTFGDFARPTNILVVIGLVVLLGILTTVGIIMVRKQIEEKKKKEQEFLEHIDNMKKEGKDPFGKELKDEEGGVVSSYSDLYGGQIPKGHQSSSNVVEQTLPGPGLGGPINSGSHVEEISLEDR